MVKDTGRKITDTGDKYAMKRLLLGLLIASASSHAQVSRTLSLSSALTGGNAQTFTLRSSANFSCDSNRLAWSATPAFALSLGPGYSLVSRDYSLTFAAHRSWGKWRVIGFADGESSLVKRIRGRGSAGLGGGVVLPPHFNVSLVILPDFYYSMNSASDVFSLRASLRTKYILEQRTRIDATLLVQPAFYSTAAVPLSRNLISRLTADVTRTLASSLSVGLQLNADYDSYSAEVNSLRALDWSVLFLIKWRRS